MSLYLAEGMTVESPAQEKQRLAAIERRRGTTEAPFTCAPPIRHATPRKRRPLWRDYTSSALFAVAVLGSGYATLYTIIYLTERLP